MGKRGDQNPWFYLGALLSFNGKNKDLLSQIQVFQWFRGVYPLGVVHIFFLDDVIIYVCCSQCKSWYRY